jgi:hypothetical protein
MDFMGKKKTIKNVIMPSEWCTSIHDFQTILKEWCTSIHDFQTILKEQGGFSYWRNY